MAEKFEISKDYYLVLMEQVLKNKQEERELALDRYRKVDDQMETAEQFVLMGKNAATFLNLASISTNDMATLAKEIKSIVYKDETTGDVSINLSDGWKEAIQEKVEEAEKRKNSMNTDINNE